jgi:hypothetical protein
MVENLWRRCLRSRFVWSRRGRQASPRPARRGNLFLEILEDRRVPTSAFQAPAAIDLGGAPTAVAVGHFRGSTAPLDVVTTNANGTVSVLLGNRDGTLHNPITLTVAGTPDAVAVADFNGDGLSDIVAANTNGTLSVLLSNGDGTFAAPQTLTLGARPDGVAVADFNGDGLADIVTANANGTVSFLAGNGDGTFAAPVTSQIGGHLTSVAVGDFNRDGTSDLVVGNLTGLNVLEGNGDGTFRVTVTVPFFIDEPIQEPASVDAVAVGSFRGDGRQDIVALANFTPNVLLGNGDGTFADPVELHVGPVAALSLTLSDFNGDGNLDIATSNGAGQFSSPSVSVLAGNGDGTFQRALITTVGTAARTLAAGDFRGIGRSDLALATDLGSNTVSVLPSNGDGTFATTPAVPINTFLFTIAAGDLSGTGRADLIAATFSNLRILLNNGDGTFHPGATLSVAAPPASVVTGDFTGDGRQDIAAEIQSGRIDVFLNNGDGTFAAPQEFNLGSGANQGALVARDFDHDGRVDLAVVYNQRVGGADHSFVKVLLSNGDGTFRDSRAIQVADESWFSIAAADFNGDGNLDLVTASALGSADVLLGHGDGTFAAPVLIPVAGDHRGVAVGDFNGDGKADLVLTDLGHVGGGGSPATRSGVSVLLGNGDGTFGQPLFFTLNSELVGGPAVGDFFGDHKISVAVTTGTSNVSVLRGNGDGTFQAPLEFLVGSHGSSPSTVVAADFNGDGKLDLATSDTVADTVSVLLNTAPDPSTANPVATTTALNVDIDSPVFGQPVPLTATVTSADGTPAVGSVTFFDGSTVLGVVAVGPTGRATLVLPLGTGVHSLTATFVGINPYTGSISAALSETVNRANTQTVEGVDILGPISGGGAEVILNATVTPVAPGAGVPTGTVIFRDGDTVIGTGQLGAGQAWLLVDLPAGTHTLTVSYSSDDNFEASVSDSVTITL